MERTLICPSDRPTVAFLAQTLPLVAVPIVGESLIASWMEFLANSGVKKILVLATDRPDLVRAAVGDGSRWGVQVHVQPELRELTPTDWEARRAAAANGAASSEPAVVIDHLPGLPEFRLFRSYREWFEAAMAWMPRPAALHRLGVRELQPGVWGGLRVHLASGARLLPPCWLGDHVQIGSNAVVGPKAVLEDRVVVDGAAEIESSLIGPDTFVGALTKVKDSIAWGSTLIDWRTNSCTQVPDPFLLCSLGQKYFPSAFQAKWGRPRGFWGWLRRPWALGRRGQEQAGG